MLRPYYIKLYNFGNSLVEGNDFEIANYEEAAYELPLRGRTLKGQPVIMKELFALGSAIYEITAWLKPFAGDEITEIENKLSEEVYPNLEVLATRGVIGKCWDEKYESVGEVINVQRDMLML